MDTPSWAEGVAISGDLVYVADEDGGLRIINVGNPRSPHEVGYYVTPDWSRGVAVSGNIAYVAAYSAGLRIIEFLGGGVEEGGTPDAGCTAPFPTIVRGVLELPPGKPGQSTTGQSLVFLLDISGRKVMELHPGRNDVSRFGPGVYFVRDLGSGVRGRREVRKVVLTQ